MFQVLILNASLKNREEVLLETSAKSVLLPGKEGEFEILDFHKPIMSRLKKGRIVVDNERELVIKGGVAKMGDQKLVAMVEV